MATDGFGDPDADPHLSDAGGQIAQEHLVVEELVRGCAMSRQPGQVLVPDDAGEDVLVVVDGLRPAEWCMSRT